MDSLDYLSLLNGSEVESTTLELKRVEKVQKPEGIDDIITIIVGMANRDGGYIYIGVEDDGSPQGKDIFEQFQELNKSGIDKIKEKINGKCLSNTSPVVEIGTDVVSSEKFEFLVIIVPKKKTIPHAVIKRKGHYIESRKYYFKTAQNCTLVSDSQLEWLFNYKSQETTIEQYYVQATTYKNMGGIPEAFGDKRGDWLVIQPQVISEARNMIHSVFEQGERVKQRLASEPNYARELFSEIMLHTMIRTTDGYGSRCIPRKAQFLPPLPNDFLFSQLLGEDKFDFFNNEFNNKLNYPRNTIVEYNKENDHAISCRISNKHCEINLTLTNHTSKSGLFGNNPYFSTMFDLHTFEFKKHTESYYSSYGYLVSVEMERKFPDVIDDIYYDSIYFYERLTNNIKYNWDYNHFLKEQHPHYRKLYAIDYKLDQILKSRQNTSPLKMVVQRATYIYDQLIQKLSNR
ncbi:TPA: ATP-binding protein [Vibrio parahaemolyticus]|nr:ATP-binding protein [Vibrio parahaemolyticus]HCG7588275.1 ATP-binding protein [Vibrio parahaemolyticus]HCH4158173.1 ATP-binding protein [Vibrio parahaemolyticus]